MENRYDSHELFGQNITDLKKWLESDKLIALVDENHGGIIGYFNRGHIKRIVNNLNSAPGLLEACRLAKHQLWKRRFKFNDNDHNAMNLLSTAIKKATE